MLHFLPLHYIPAEWGLAAHFACCCFLISALLGRFLSSLMHLLWIISASNKFLFFFSTLEASPSLLVFGLHCSLAVPLWYVQCHVIPLSVKNFILFFPSKCLCFWKCMYFWGFCFSAQSSQTLSLLTFQLAPPPTLTCCTLLCFYYSGNIYMAAWPILGPFSPFFNFIPIPHIVHVSTI